MTQQIGDQHLVAEQRVTGLVGAVLAAAAVAVAHAGLDEADAATGPLEASDRGGLAAAAAQVDADEALEAAACLFGHVLTGREPATHGNVAGAGSITEGMRSWRYCMYAIAAGSSSAGRQ